MELARKGKRRLEEPPTGEDWVSGHRETRSCGDAVTIHLRLRGSAVEDARYTAVGCALALASAELVTETLPGRAVEDAVAFLRDAAHVLDTPAGMQTGPEPEGLEELAVVRKHPARKRCVLLALEAALEALMN